MRKNKKLQEMANKSLQKIKNDDILNNLLQEQKRLKEERNIKTPFYTLKQFKVACMTCACMIVSLAVVLCVVFIKPNDTANNINNNNQNVVDNTQQPNINEPQTPVIPHYAERNKVTDIVTKDCLDNLLENTGISISDMENCVITEAKDSISGDKLYYVLEINDEAKMLVCKLEIVTNKNYNYGEIKTNFEEIILGKKFNIKTQCNVFEDGLYIHTVNAETEVDGVKIIIREFTSITMSEDSGFKEFIESIFSFS